MGVGLTNDTCHSHKHNWKSLKSPIETHLKTYVGCGGGLGWPMELVKATNSIGNSFEKSLKNPIKTHQGGITCGAIDEPRKSSKVIDERVIINFCNKNVVNARFRDKNGGFIF